MKLILVFLSVLAVALGYQIEETLDLTSRSVSSQIVDWIEWQKQAMPCGFPSRGWGPLSPMQFTEKEIALQSESFDLEGQIKNFIMYGLDNFDIEEFKINLILSKLNFKFHWHHVHLDTIYRALMRTTGNTKVSLQRNGGAKIALKDFMIWGQAKYSLGALSGNLRLKEFKVYVSLGEVKSEIENLSNIKIINRKLNEIIEEWLMLAINDNTEAMGELTNNVVVPIVNDLIGDRSLGDIIAMIAGGGGGEGGEPVEKVPCVPPTVFGN